MGTTAVGLLTPLAPNTLTIGIRGAGQNGDLRKLGQKTAEAITTVTNFANALNSSTAELFAGGSTPSVTPLLYQANGTAYAPDFTQGLVQAFTMTGNTAVGPAVNGIPGQEMTIFVIEDATGGWTLTWDAMFHFAGTFAPDPTPNAATVYKFVWSPSGNMIQSNAPVTGMVWP